MNVQTKEMDTLRGIFPQATCIIDSINNNQDSHYSVWFFLGFSDYDLNIAEDHGFEFQHASPHVTDKGHGELCVSFTKYADCIHCGTIERRHNFQQAGTFCQEEFQKGLTSFVYTEETEKQRYAKYGKEYYK